MNLNLGFSEKTSTSTMLSVLRALTQSVKYPDVIVITPAAFARHG